MPGYSHQAVFKKCIHFGPVVAAERVLGGFSPMPFNRGPQPTQSARGGGSKCLTG
jgi:hypothetical protein